MAHIEAFTCAKDPRRPETNEDRIVIIPDIAYAVIDGATDISGKRWNDVLGRDATGGRLASAAVARAICDIAAAPFDALPESPAKKLNGALTELYARLGILEEARSHSEARFRTTVAVAFVAAGRMRLFSMGDSGFRVNGKPLLRHTSSSDVVLSAARALAWHALTARGVPPDGARSGARALIVSGLDPAHPAGGLTAAEIGDIMVRAAAEPRAIAATGGDGSRAMRILRAGLSGIRRAPAEFDAHSIDGFHEPAAPAASRDFDADAVETLEIFSDGYPAMPDEATVAAWEAKLRHADTTDPERIGEFASTKGRVGCNFGDDRSVIIVRRDGAAA